MQTQIENPSCRDSYSSATQEAIDSIDAAIVHLDDLETQKVLRKYGFDVNSLVHDLQASKEDVVQLQDSQQRVIKHFEEHTKSERRLGVMADRWDDINNQITVCLKTGQCHKINLFSIIADLTLEDRKNYANRLQLKKSTKLQKIKELATIESEQAQTEVTQAEKEKARRVLTDCYDTAIRQLLGG